MTRIFIEDNELDLDQDLSNQITYAIDDLNNLDSKSTAFSKTIVVPGSTNNNDLLGNIFDINNSNYTIDTLPNVKYNYNASKTAKCRIEVNGLQIIKGVFRILEIIYNGSQVEYECAVFGELGGFVSALGNNRLEDLDFSAYDETYAISGITASWNNANSGTGLYYPLIDYGAVSTNKNDYQYTTLRPALHVAEYMDKIITGAGYTYESTFFATDFFKRLIVPHNAKALTKSGTTLANGLLTNGNYDMPLVQPTIGTLSATDFIALLTIYPALKYTGSSSIVTDINFRIQGTYNYDLLITPRQGITFELRHYISATTTTIAIDDKDFGVLVSLPDTATSFDIVLTATNILIAPNDEIHLLFNSADSGGSNVDITWSSLKVDSQTPTLINVNIGDALVINDTIPKGIFQKDFFTSILKMFYLMVTEDKFISKHLIIEPWVDFFNTSPSTYLDWSNKIDRGKQIRVKPMSEINSRFYELKYKSDSDFYNEAYRKKFSEGYGDRIFDNALDFAKEKETVEVIFAATPLVGYPGEDKVVPTIYKKSSTTEEGIDCVIRIMQAKKITGVAAWDILNGVSVLSSPTDYGYAGHLDDPDAPASDIGFGIPKELYFTLVSGDLTNNLFNVYYSSYFAEITDKDSRLLQAMAKLTDQDIFDLDFSRFIYVDGGLFRLSKVIDYAAGMNDLTKVELLKAIYTTY